MTPAETSPRGHLILKSHTPLPRFTCAIPVPHPDTTIEQLRTTIVAILTGQVSAKSSPSSSSSFAVSKANGNGLGPSGGYSSSVARAEEAAALSYSEHLKQVTIHEWRMKSVILELRQNALIAPETRGAVNDKNQEEVMSGFELQDDHECGLLEHGDEVNLRLKPGQTLESLRLPKLSSKHMYGFPKQPALDKSGTVLLGSADNPADFAFTSPQPVVREPLEPSSHSSSVSANPDVQFETKNRHWIAPNQSHRVVVVNSGGGGSSGLNNKNNLISSAKRQNKASPREKPRRLNSASYFSPQLVDQKQRESQQAPQRSKSGPVKTVSPPTTAQSPLQIVTQSTVLTTSPISSPSPILNSDEQTTTRKSLPRQPSSPNLYQSLETNQTTEAISAQLKARQASFIRAEKQERESKMRKAIDQKKMPSGALIVGPGVQGKVGNLPASANRVGSHDRSNGTLDQRGDQSDSYGNLDAFVSFTAASSDAYKPVRPHIGQMRRQSNRSGTSGEKVEAENRRPSERRRSSFGKVLEKRASETSVKKAENPPTNRRLLNLLPPMPMPSLIRTGSLSKSWQDLLQPLDAPFTPTIKTPSSQVLPSPMEINEEDASLAASLEASLAAASQSTNTTPHQGLSLLTAQEEPPSSSALSEETPEEATEEDDEEELDEYDEYEEETTSPTLEDLAIIDPAEQGDSSTRHLSKAERRYQDVMKSLEVEREKQSQEEKQRREAVAKREDAKVKALAKLEEDQRKRKETLKWQMWEEIRVRQEKEKQKGGR